MARTHNNDAVSVPKRLSVDGGMLGRHVGMALDINLYAQVQQARTAQAQASRPVACRLSTACKFACCETLLLQLSTLDL